MKKFRLRALNREINEIIIHCTDTLPLDNIDMAWVDRLHRNQGWDCCGYHFVVKTDGTVEQGRDIVKAGAHCHGHNVESIGIAYVGGNDYDGRHADTRTPAQHVAIRALLVALHALFPNAEIHGHREFANKDCPCFDARKEYADIEDDTRFVIKSNT